MSKIGINEVERVAKLAHITLSPEETAQMAVEMGSIVEFVEQLQKVNTKDVETTDQVTGLVDVWRADEVTNKPNRDKLLANAPVTQDGYIKVRRVQE